MHRCKWLLVFGLLLGGEVRGETPSEPILPVQPAKITDVAKVELGKQLFFDPRLSKSGFISCNSCHNLSMGGSDNLPTSIGHNWHQGPINSPTVLNSGLSFAQYWDGRAATLQEQASGPITNPGEMGFSHELAVEVLRSIPQYRASFKRVYGNDEISFEDATNAIAAFEDTLVTPNAPFDRWLKGDKAAISPTAFKGYQLFKSIGCVACHNGEAVGGGSFQKMGMLEPYVTKNPAQGVAGLTGKDADRMLFKVPTLRNVALTYPYFHDGAYWKLEEAVDVMARLQLGRQLDTEEVGQIVAFLETLTGDQPDFKLPILPPSSAQTPRPQPFN
ncbi:cytochrome C biogenesis protein CcsA [Pseudomonas sp. TKO26]|uniref:cytochrome-c peroxidase n=1 Tax=unclassified Pseudomonas TaxID=196821 RepID=UPI000D84A026|nr:MULTISPECIES: cytochrome-c peroxidase [unclassified Pseudomonas]PYY92025.1 cytochrome C biogenesis protein CcsA [Pseudomonas sp. TKO30]PYY94388.1 cytochrome C biogenesis protein CcsA [Pseudomonas sp. TKO29]PYY96261.1 cytochrome C biogenesis protein CcsA [Pseudomonas sp. TKO26]PYZ01853.1 cytochrome C biogenesis protein CcsA [Pseudomonas sp. TKO14]